MLSKTHRLLLEKHLADAKRHITLGQKRLEDQSRLVARLARDGHDTEEAEKLLGSFKQMYNLHVEHFGRLLAELADADRAEVWDDRGSLPRYERSPPAATADAPVTRANEGRVVGPSRIATDVSEQAQSHEPFVALAREAEHRSRNLLATVIAAVKLSQSQTLEGLKQVIEGRILALANVHSLLVEARWIGAELSTIAKQELAPYFKEGEMRVRFDGPHVALAPNSARSIAAILHELATNAAKYGALSSLDGRIDLSWSRESSGRVELCWTETGGPPVKKPTRMGFGGSTINLLVGPLMGKALFDWRPEGLHCKITVDVC
jgi:two-component sensor histidine kinase